MRDKIRTELKANKDRLPTKLTIAFYFKKLKLLLLSFFLVILVYFTAIKPRMFKVNNYRY